MRSGSIILSAAAPRYKSWLAPLLLFFGVVTVSSVGLQRIPSTDELYTMLAARGWAATGVPVIAEGVYDRAQLYTALIGSLFRAFGDSLVVARLASVVASGLLVAAVFLWTRRSAGALAAWVAAVLLCFSPLPIYISQFARFYALFGLLFWLGAIGVYYLSEHWSLTTRSALVALGSSLCFLLALHLQVLAAMGLLGLAIWFVYAQGLPWLRAGRIDQRRWTLLIGLGAAAIFTLAALVYTGLAAELWERYRATPEWNKLHRNEFWFYHVFFNQRFQSLWPIFPFLAIVAVAARPKPALFCFVIFCTALLLLSFGGMKDRRYVFFILPFLFVLWGIALADLLPLVRRHLGPRTLDALRQITPGAASPWVQRVVIGLGLLFLIAANGAPMKTAFGLAGLNLFAEGSGADFTTSPMRSDWAAVREPLRPWLEKSDVVLASHDVQTLYFVGRSDFVVNNNRLSEIGTGEFGIDPRTGLPVVVQPESLELIIDCYQHGLIVAEARTWRTFEAIPDATADLIEAKTSPIGLPARFEVLAFTWDHPADRQRGEQCAALP